MISIFYHNVSFSFFCIVFFEGVTDATRRFSPVYGNTDPCKGYSQYLLPLFSLRRFKRTRVLDYLGEESRQMVSLFLRASRSSCDLRSVAFICLQWNAKRFSEGGKESCGSLRNWCSSDVLIVHMTDVVEPWFQSARAARWRPSGCAGRANSMAWIRSEVNNFEW